MSLQDKLANKKAKDEQNSYKQTDFYINFRTPLGVVGVRLCEGIDQHDSFLAIIAECGVDGLNKYFELEEYDAYATQAGIKNNTKVKDIIAKLKAMNTQ